MYGYGREQIALTRDVEALQVPSGSKVTLKAGSVVTLTQALGGNFTVIAADGNMARIDGENADALGKEKVVAPQLHPKDVSRETVEKAVWEQLKTCYDPEIPVDIVELGLVYQCDVTPSVLDDKIFSVYIQMTLTAPGCGMGDVIAAEARTKVERIPGVREVEVELTFEPPWSREMMSEAARLQLGML
ncbi:MAG: putative Fe-S cluster assembly protein SufT [Bdellovibrionales bacterium]|nr:putative Fe-S cluster assembly protein SufT [Bdellovibrionales bacterium]